MSSFIDSLSCRKLENQGKPSEGDYECLLTWHYLQGVNNPSELNGADNSVYVLDKAKKVLFREIYGNMPEQLSALRQYIMMQSDDPLRHNTLLLIDAIREGFHNG